MCIKKIVSVILSCALVINAYVVNLAFAENELSLINEINDLKKQIILLEAKKNVSEVKIEKLKKEIKSLNEKLKEEREKAELNKKNQKVLEKSIKKLEKQNSELIAEQNQNTTGWFYEIARNLTEVIIFSIGLSIIFEKPYAILGVKLSEEACPEFLIPLRDFGAKIVDWFLIR